jgi:hypothetical protein
MTMIIICRRENHNYFLKGRKTSWVKHQVNNPYYYF